MKTTAPILSKLLHDKDPRSGRSFDLALEHLNVGAANGQIWNVEVNDAKFTLSNAVDRALDVIYHKYLGGRGRDNYEEWTNDLSMYCSFNQAKGRIARLQRTLLRPPSSRSSSPLTKKSKPSGTSSAL